MRMVTFTEVKVLSQAPVRVMEFFLIKMKTKFTADTGMIINIMEKESSKTSRLNN
jgi:hypothetical protein